MFRPQFSLRWLMGWLSFIAIGCGLLRFARPVSAQLTLAATLAALFAAIPLSVYRDGEKRAFWFGFALFGLGYLGIICGPWQAPDGGISGGLRESLPTNKLLEIAFSRMPTKAVGTGTSGGGGMFQISSGGMGGGAGWGGFWRGATRVPVTEWKDFEVVGHCLWTIAIALAGGIFTGRVHRSRRASALPGAYHGPVA